MRCGEVDSFAVECLWDRLSLALWIDMVLMKLAVWLRLNDMPNFTLFCRVGITERQVPFESTVVIVM